MTALRTVDGWRRQRHIRLRRPVVVQRPVVLLDTQLDSGSELYEPPGDALSEGYVSSGCTDSLGSLGGLVDRPTDLPPVDADGSGSDFEL